MNKRPLQLCLFIAILLGLGACGYWLLFTQFMVYDDEGYVLWSLHNYFQSGGLYTEVYSQYGPFLYAFYHGVHALFGITFDNETGRYLTLGYWLASAGLAGIFVWRQTQHLLTALTSIALTFGGLLVMINEPIHPGGLLAMLTAVAGMGGAMALEKNRFRVFALICGVCGAAMLLTKINVGAFFLISAGSWGAIHWANTVRARALLWFTAGGSILLPLWLMNQLWPEPWVAIFALSFACAALALLLLIKEQHRPTVRVSEVLLFAGSTAVSLSIILGAIWMRGTDLATLWHGIVIAPLGQPIAYAHAVNWPAVTPAVIAIMFAIALIAHSRKYAWITPTIVIIRLLTAAWLLVLTFSSIDNSLSFFSFQWGLPFAWLMAVPLGERTTSPLKSARLWLAWVFVWQTLHAYPVAGSQMGWGSFLWIPLAMTGIHEAILYSHDHLPRYGRAIKWSATLAGLIAIGSIIYDLGYPSYQRYQLGEPLKLHGAQTMRLTDDSTLVYRILDKNIRTHGDMLFSYPGLYSLNIWTERPTPTAHNVTHWFSLLTETQQHAILEKLQAEDRSVIVVQSYLINYLVLHGFPPRSELQRYLVENYHSVFSLDTFQFWVKNGRSVAPISTAGLYINEQSGSAILQLVTDAQGQVASVELRGLFHPYNRVRLASPSAESPWSVTPINPDNSPRGETMTITQPAPLEGLSKLEIPLPYSHPLPALGILKAVLKDDRDETLDTLQFSQ